MSRQAPPSLDSLTAPPARQAPPSLGSLQAPPVRPSLPSGKKPAPSLAGQRPPPPSPPAGYDIEATSPGRKAPPSLDQLRKPTADYSPPQPNSMMQQMQNNSHDAAGVSASTSGCLLKLGLAQTAQPPMCHVAVNAGVACCCCCMCTPVCAHYLARPADLTTRSFLGLVAYYCVYWVLIYLYFYVWHGGDNLACVTPTGTDEETGAPEYHTGCYVIGWLQWPMLFYTLFVVLLSEKQQPSGKPLPCKGQQAPSSSGAIDLER
jgi:hypothetical protein